MRAWQPFHLQRCWRACSESIGWAGMLSRCQRSMWSTPTSHDINISKFAHRHTASHQRTLPPPTPLRKTNDPTDGRTCTLRVKGGHVHSRRQSAGTRGHTCSEHAHRCIVSLLRAHRIVTPDSERAASAPLGAGGLATRRRSVHAPGPSPCKPVPREAARCGHSPQ